MSQIHICAQKSAPSGGADEAHGAEALYSQPHYSAGDGCCQMYGDIALKITKASKRTGIPSRTYLDIFLMSVGANFFHGWPMEAACALGRYLVDQCEREATHNG